MTCLLVNIYPKFGIYSVILSEAVRTMHWYCAGGVLAQRLKRWFSMAPAVSSGVVLTVLTRVDCIYTFLIHRPFNCCVTFTIFFFFYFLIFLI